MTTWFNWFLRKSADLVRRSDGNLSVAFAIMIVPLLVSVGAALDYQNAFNERTRLQNDLDAALLQAVLDVDNTDQASIKKNIRKWMTARYSNTGNFSLDDNLVVIDSVNGTVSSQVTSSIKTTFLNVIGVKAIPITVKSTANTGETVTSQNAFSMYLVLDRSGSMDEATTTSYTYNCGKKKKPKTCTGFYTKMESLQIAVSALTTQISTADPLAMYARLGVVSFNSAPQLPVSLAFGTSLVSNFVSALFSTGGTDSSGAMQLAYDALMDPVENKAHLLLNGKVPDKFIVFMTDGDNNTTSADTTTRAVCDKARLAKIRVFTVALMAPSRGQTLLKYCATNPSDYFTVDTTAELVSAFKIIGQTSSKTSVRLTN